MSASTSDGSRLPVELYRPVLEHLRNLYYPIHKISYVSRTWRHEVEAVQYLWVKVPDTNILFFCQTIKERPDLARRVRRFSFTSAAHRPRQPGDTEFLQSTLHALVNLRDLSILESPSGMVEEWVVTHMDYWVLDGCTFKLSRYATHLLWSKELASFLASQPSLREFQFFGGTTADSERVDVPDHALPRCNVLRVSAHMLPDFKARRNITHLRVDMFHNNAEEEKRMAKSIKRYGHMLKVLALVRRVGPEEYLSTPSILKHFIEQTPHLVCLALYDTLDFSPVENKKILKLMSQNLRNLQVLIWAPLHDGHHMDDDIDSSEDESGFSADSDSDEDSKSKVNRYALVVMAAMPSLKYFISMRDRGMEGWLRDAQGNIIRHIPPMPTLENCYASVNPQDPLDYFLRPGFRWVTESLDMTERYYLPYDMPPRRTTQSMSAH